MFRSTLSSIAQLIVGLAVIAGGISYFQPDAAKDLYAIIVGSPEAETSAHQKQSPTAKGPGIVALSADQSGHFEVSALINGRHVPLLADTGASIVFLNYDEAKRLGLKPETLTFDGRSVTANGEARIAFTTLDKVTVGPITLRDVRAAVSEPGAMKINLLGMSFIGRLSKFELKGNQLVLHR